MGCRNKATCGKGGPEAMSIGMIGATLLLVLSGGASVMLASYLYPFSVTAIGQVVCFIPFVAAILFVGRSFVQSMRSST